MSQPELTLHVLPSSHPSFAARRALELKGLEFEQVMLQPGPHTEEITRIYGEGRTTVPGMLVDGEPVHGSGAIMERLDQLTPEAALFPDPIADEVREAARWGDAEVQDLGRRLSFGALHFRPEHMGTFGRAPVLDPAGTDFAIRYIRQAWRYHGITAAVLAEDLAGLPAKLARIDELASAGIVGGEQANAADLELGATLRVLLCIGDVRPLVEASAGAEIARRWFPEYPGDIPAGAFPQGWVPPGPSSS